MDNTTAINEMVRTLTVEGLMELDGNRQREDMMGLISDIRTEIKSKAPDSERQIYMYAALLQEELDLYVPMKAFEAGVILGCNSDAAENDCECAFMQYVSGTELNPEAKRIHRQVDAMYRELHALLGETCSLIDEFTELYRQCHGVIRSKIGCFFDMGYALTQADSAQTS